ncbi:MAG: indole-3-glycerol phosphate synthase TrpC [Deltaproteobacteria bacterium HGW-Deltaproteobacteria-6]|jgi:indole-3-glycerol phosphate synthase|nr:MAG: indole-3-glycerol phosphate synthase TrpC [Deltaproteobacteria bacterium HGW-Deltaproteobacteria-6]
MILDKIIETKKQEVELLKNTTTESALKNAIVDLPPCRDFRAAISGKACSIIAEVKCASPSRGRLVEHFDPSQIAKIYEKNGAAAISVLTDEQYFCGHKDYLTQIKQEVQIPVLRKDFIIDPLQVYETRAIGADAILLIVRVLGTRLAEFIALSKELDLSPLVEVHTQEELDMALAAGAEIIGVNNRNLDTFVTDINTSRDLKKLIPAGKTIVAESAIKDRADIEYLTAAGINAFLIGEGLVIAPDIGKKLRSFLGENVQ